MSFNLITLPYTGLLSDWIFKIVRVGIKSYSPELIRLQKLNRFKHKHIKEINANSSRFTRVTKLTAHIPVKCWTPEGCYYMEYTKTTENLKKLASDYL